MIRPFSIGPPARTRLALLLAASMWVGNATTGVPPLAAQTTAFPDTILYTPDSAPGGAWLLGPPALSLGEGSEAEEFSNVAAVIVLRDGRLVVVDGGSREVRIFDDQGHFLSRFGGKGDGFGEFPSLPWGAWVVADTLTVVDAARRAHIFTVDGTFIRSEAPLVSDRGTRMRRLGPLAPGVTLARYATPPILLKEPESIPYELVAVAGADVRPLLALPGYTLIPEPGGQPRGLVYGPRLDVATRPGGFCTTFPKEYVIECREPDGTPRLRIRRTGVATRKVTDGARETFFQGLARANPGDESYLEQMRRSVDFATDLPVIGRLVLSEQGDIWVGPYVIEDETLGTFNPSPPDPTEWDVYAYDGAWRGRIQLPARFRLMWAGRSAVAGVTRDSRDVEHVVIFPLRNAAPNGPSGS